MYGKAFYFDFWFGKTSRIIAKFWHFSNAIAADRKRA